MRMSDNINGEWIVQIDRNTGKERDDFYYLYCKEHNIPCSKPRLVDTSESVSKVKKKPKPRVSLDKEAIYHLYNVEKCDFYEIALVYNITEARVKQIVEQFQDKEAKQKKQAKAAEARNKRDLRIIALHTDGMSASDIAKICGCSIPTVHTAIKSKAALERAAQLIHEDSIKTYYAEGKTIEWLASYHNMSQYAVRRILGI